MANTGKVLVCAMQKICQQSSNEHSMTWQLHEMVSRPELARTAPSWRVN
ncbi:MAG: hypothetical protein ACI9DC_001076 [Gammaproteobacteria bacterium]|jgi:hypothetical protein